MAALSSELQADPVPGGLRLTGEITLVSVDGLEALVRDVSGDGSRDLLLDVAQVTMCDSTGVSLLLRAARRGARHGRRVLLSGAGGHLLRTLDVCGLTPMFDFSNDGATADSHLA